MPFQSEKQRRYLWANHPTLARKWTDQYGSAAIRKKAYKKLQEKKKKDGRAKG